MTIIPDPVLVLLQALPFLLTVFALKAIIFDPMLAYLDGRHEATVGGRREVQELQDRAAAHLAAYEKRLDEARSEAAAIRARHRQAALASYAHKIEEARAAAAREVEDGVGQIERAKRAARKDLEEMIRSLGTQIATQVLGRESRGMKWLGALLLITLPAIARAEEIEAHSEGIPLGKIALHALNLAVLFGIIGWFARKPIKDAIASRAASIKKDMDEINALRKQAQDRYSEIETRLQAYDKKLAEMKGEAEKEAAAEAREIAARAERDAQQIQAAAQRTIRDETLRARHALRKDAVELAVKIAEEQLKRTITEDDQRRLAAEFLQTVESNGNG